MVEARTPAAICGEMETVRARRVTLDLIAQRDGDLTDEQDREWQALDEREAALSAELRDWIFLMAGLSMDRLREAVA